MWQVIDEHKKRWCVTGSLKLALQMRGALLKSRNLRSVVVIGR
jgi:hypothetical protein